MCFSRSFIKILVTSSLEITMIYYTIMEWRPSPCSAQTGVTSHSDRPWSWRDSTRHIIRNPSTHITRRGRHVLQCFPGHCMQSPMYTLQLTKEYNPCWSNKVRTNQVMLWNKCSVPIFRGHTSVRSILLKIRTKLVSIESVKIMSV